ncbi:MAG: XRE family transcriptional regulator, partial [Dehalococcoidia bacterium]
SARGVSRAELAERLGTSRAYVTKLLEGQENMTVKTLVRVANALEMKVAMKLVPRQRASRPVTSGRSAGASKVRAAPSRRSPAKRVAVAARARR